MGLRLKEVRAIVVTVNELKQNPIPFPLSTIQFSSTILRYMHITYITIYTIPQVLKVESVTLFSPHQT